MDFFILSSDTNGDSSLLDKVRCAIKEAVPNIPVAGVEIECVDVPAKGIMFPRRYVTEIAHAECGIE